MQIHFLYNFKHIYSNFEDYVLGGKDSVEQIEIDLVERLNEKKSNSSNIIVILLDQLVNDLPCIIPIGSIDFKRKVNEIYENKVL